MNRNKNSFNCKTRTSNMKDSDGKQKVPYKFKSKPHNKNKNKSQKIDGQYGGDSAHDGIPGKQDAGLYFGDLQLAEDNSYVSSRNVLDIRRKMPGTNFYYPTVFVHGFNPSPGVSYADLNDFIVYPSGLKLAANELKTAIIANNGRITNYTSTDIVILLLMTGEFISMTEYMRRIFGAKYKFAELNRDIPKSFVEAMGIDYDDFIDNYNSYQSRANKLINYGAPIVIPMDKIPYLRKCRDLYQDIYQDQAAGQMCYHINVPRTTWHLVEDETFGTRLKTVGVTQDISQFYVVTNQTDHRYFGTKQAQKYNQRIRNWTFDNFLTQVYEPLVMSLTTSETFNNIYSDLRSAKFQSVYPFNFWKPELITTEYECPVVESEDWLNIYHNARYAGDVTYGMDYSWPGEETPVFPKLNDVVTDPVSDDLRYNPIFVSTPLSDAIISASLKNEYIMRQPYILDFPDVNPHVNKRVDAMIYTAWPRGEEYHSRDDFNPLRSQANWLLPDHYMTNWWAYVGEVAPEFPRDTHYWPINTNGLKIGFPTPGFKSGDTYTFPNLYEVVENGGITLKDDKPFNVQSTNPRLVEERLQYVNYLEGAPIGFEDHHELVDTLESGPNVYEIIYDAPVGNLDEWYVLDITKFENMFDHVYQYIFTADGVVK